MEITVNERMNVITSGRTFRPKKAKGGGVETLIPDLYPDTDTELRRNSLYPAGRIKPYDADKILQNPNSGHV